MVTPPIGPAEAAVPAGTARRGGHSAGLFLRGAVSSIYRVKITINGKFLKFEMIYCK
jgi:hypothetical protein